MDSNDLVEYMQEAARSMQSEYYRIQKRASEDPGTAGDNGEENWADLLRRWLPKYYSVVTKGRIMNVEGHCGPQVDVLVLSPAYPDALKDKKEYLETGVIAAFECKLTLKGSHIRKAVENASELRRNASYQQQGSPFRELRSEIVYGLLAHSHVWQNEKSTPIPKIAEELLKSQWTHTKHPQEVLDLICVADLASWNTFRHVHSGDRLLSQTRPRHIPEDTWNSYREAEGVVQVDHCCLTDLIQGDSRNSVFSPIGFFLSSLLEKMAWKDTDMRMLSLYFGSIGKPQGWKSNPSGGVGIIWPASVLSKELRARLSQGRYERSSELWSEWGAYF